MNGIIMETNANIIWDEEAKVYVVTNDELGIVLEGESKDALIQRFMVAAEEMISLREHDAKQTQNAVFFYEDR